MYVIEKWLNGPRNFYVGKAVYLSLGTDKRLIEVLNNGKTPIAEELLLKALQQLCSAPKAAATQRTKPEVDEMPVGSDPVSESIHQEWKKPYLEMNYKRHQLDQYQGDDSLSVAKRKELAFEILELEQQCMKIWKKRDYYQEHGKLPDVSEMKIELPTDPLELGKLLESVKKNIRRNKLQMQKFPGEPVYPQKYHEYKSMYQQITGKEYAEKETKVNQPE